MNECTGSKYFLINVISAASSRGSAPTWRRTTAGYTAAPTSDQSTRCGVMKLIFIITKNRSTLLIVKHLSKLEKASFNEFYETVLMSLISLYERNCLINLFKRN